MLISKIWPIGVLMLMVVFMAQQSLSISLDEDDSGDFYEETVVLKTKMGALRGHKEVVDSKVSYYAFKGIRYAKAPTKERRFQPPEPETSWMGIRSALRDGHLCPQFSIATNAPIGDEDCLTLNVYTPSVRGSRAVMVYLHGGAFVVGGGVSYYFGPKLLVEQDVVLVTVQYRLGALGFLSTGDNRASGNWGLLDQLAALRWVKENIAFFGGNPESLTLFGEDSGAASASLLTMSPLAEGLFHRVIALSGNAICAQYIQQKPREATVELARRLDCSGNGSQEILDCLRRISIQDFILKSNEMYVFYSFPRWFVPVVDGTVLPAHPEEILKKGSFFRLPTVVGQTKDEGAFFYRLTINTMNSGRYDDSFIDNLPRLLPIMSELDRKLLPLSKAIRRKYFRNVDLEQEDQFRPKYVEFLTDLLYTRCTDRYSRLLANQSVPTYRYLFEYRGQYSIVNLRGEDVDFGVAHGDDLQYVFSDLWGQDLPMSIDDLKFSKNIFVPLLANFAKTGVPTPSITEHIPTAWAPFSSSKSRLFRIDSTPALDMNYRADVNRFWNEEVPAMLQFSGKSKKILTSDAAGHFRKEEL